MVFWTKNFKSILISLQKIYKIHFFRCLVVFFLLITQSAFAQQEQRPNVLWITIEDTSPQFIGAYGNSDADTPNIDRLAAEGVRFTSAFSTNTVCSPSRSSIITGSRTYKMGTGNHRSNYSIPDFIKGFPYYLQQQGYYTSNNSKTDYNVGNVEAFTNEAWNESSDTAGWWNRSQQQPFFSVFNFATSHQSRTMTWPYKSYVDEVLNNIPESERIPETAFAMPPFYRDSPAMRKQFARVYNSIKLTDTEIGALLDRLEEDGLKENTIIFMYADHGEGMPRGKTNGIDFGYRVPFIVWFPEKYEALSPWDTGGTVTDELISFEDLAPTMVSLTGGTPPDYMEGRVLMGDDRSEPTDHLFLSADRADNGIDMVRSITDGRYMYSRNYFPYMPQTGYIRYMEIGEIKKQMRDDLAEGKLNTLQRSLFEARPPEYLYDTKNDLWETENLVNDRQARPVLQRMRKQLKEEILQSRDVMFLPEYEIGKISENEAPYEYRLDPRKYAIEDIYKTASLSGKRGEEIAKQQVAALKSDNNIIRYWAIVGLRSQPSEVLKPYRKEVISAMADTYPPVKVTASVLAFQEFGNKESEQNINQFIKSENADLALMTINYLLYMQNKEPFAEQIKTAAKTEGMAYRVQSACKDFMRSLERGD
jgi:arylsulfatase A-like enzyme